ncbi:hypothetical protein AB0L40_19615 [Patulibacter sp. NPDC049589]|uniref:hypothetical protein n=1 Tax=Patulibacter sp. NPDC049589 TaxID=3154731 RepID=UPI00341B373C
MDQHTYSFPKVSPADPHELRESLRATRREASDDAAKSRRDAEGRRPRQDARRP